MHGIFCGRKASVSWTSGIWTQLLNDWLATIRTASRHSIVCASSWMHRKWSGSGTGRYIYISPHFQLTIHWLCGGDVPMSTTNCQIVKLNSIGRLLYFLVGRLLLLSLSQTRNGSFACASNICYLIFNFTEWNLLKMSTSASGSIRQWERGRGVNKEEREAICTDIYIYRWCRL